MFKQWESSDRLQSYYDIWTTRAFGRPHCNCIYSRAILIRDFNVFLLLLMKEKKQL